MMLEASQHEHSSFVTLTYAEDKLPRFGSLVPEHYRGWVKRLRFHYSPAKFRYFVVGEYGEISGRPHYHAALFGFPGCVDVVGARERLRLLKEGCKCQWCSLVRSTWDFGHVTLGSLTRESAQYIAGYCVKKMTNAQDARLAPGQYPEFARMSLKPGVGVGAIADVASEILTHGLENGRIPTTLCHGNTYLPLGRYLSRRLKAETGVEDDGKGLEELKERLRPVFEAAAAVIPRSMGGARDAAVAAALGKANEQSARNLAARIGKRRSAI